MKVKEFKSKISQLKKTLNEYRVYNFNLTSSSRLEISCPTEIFTPVVIHEIFSVFPVDSDVELSFFHGYVVLERFDL